MPAASRHCWTRSCLRAVGRGQLPIRTLLVGILLTALDKQPLHLTRVHAALQLLPQADQRRLRVRVPGRSGEHTATYRQVTRLFDNTIRQLDASPSPSYRGVAPADRERHFNQAQPAPNEAAERDRRLAELCDRLLDATLGTWKSASSHAVDWTDVEAWARRPTNKQQPWDRADSNAAWGRRPPREPGITDSLFFGFDEQVVVTVNDEGRPRIPELVRRLDLQPANKNQPNALLDVLSRMKHGGAPIGDLLADAGYSHKVDWLLRVRALGFAPVADLHPKDRGLRGTHEGALVIEGELYCPSTPKELWDIPPLGRGASSAGVANHDRLIALREKYRLGIAAVADGDGFYRVACPAALGKVRCPLRVTSLSLGFGRPEILKPPNAPPKCCTQRTITVTPDVGAKVRQKHTYGSPTFRESYKRRSAAERAFATVKDRAGEDLTRGRIRLMGRAKTMLMRTFAWAARNCRIIDAYLAQARRPTPPTPPQPRRRKRRRGPSLATLAQTRSP